MAEEPAPVADTPRQLLSTTQELTRRVRKAQRGTWFPLVLLGLVIVAAAPFYRVGSHPNVTDCTVRSSYFSNIQQAVHGGGAVKTCFIVYGWPAFSYWVVALAGAYVVIAGFYVHRARRRGVGARVGPYVMAGIAGLMLAASCWLVQHYLANLQSRYQADLVVHGLNPLLTIGIALFVLAWVERSRALLVFAAGNLVAVLTNFYDIDGLLRDHGWVVARQWIFLPRLWLAGAVLLLGGAGFAVAERLRK
jgi:hypothetical protein